MVIFVGHEIQFASAQFTMFLEKSTFKIEYDSDRQNRSIAIILLSI
jgi:hypothetical protein